MSEINIEVALECYCSDLLGLEQSKQFVSDLLSLSLGEWCKVSLLVSDSNLDIFSACPQEESLFVTWLNDPGNDEPYKFIIFYDLETGWSFTASYNGAVL
jgi:hypothetical protein